MNTPQTTTEFAAPQRETLWSRVKKTLAPLAVIGVMMAKFFAKLKFFILPALKFLPILLKSGGTMLLMIWVYTALWGWKFGVGFVGPMLGSLGALVCNSLGEIFDAPVFIALAWFGYFLNLFNLTPVGMLDGGRIVTALSRWLWIPGFAVLVWFGWQYPNFVVWLMVFLSLPRIVSLFRKRTEEEKRYYEVAPMQRLTMSILYFGLIATLLFAMHLAQNDLHQHGVRAHGRGRDTIVQ